MQDLRNGIRVVHIQRRPLPTQFSVEGYFERVRDSWPSANIPMLFQAPCISHGFWNRIRNLWTVRRLRADVYHVTGDIQYVCCVLPKEKCCLTVLDCEVLHRTKGIRRRLLKLLWYTLPARFCAHITVISEETKRQLLREITFPTDRIHVIPVSVSALFIPEPRPFNSDCPRILQVGTKPNKNLPRLIQALSGIRCHLEIVGPLNKPHREMLKNFGVEYTNRIGLSDEQLVERYREADMVSFVSTHEGFGMPIIEAQCIERVCITSNCSSMPEVAGGGACLVDPFDVQSIRQGIQRLISDSDYRNEIIDKGRANRERFNPVAIAQQFDDLYKKIHVSVSHADSSTHD